MKRSLWITATIVFVGAALSGLVAWTAESAEREMDRSRRERIATSRAESLHAHLASRATIARAVVAMWQREDSFQPRALARINPDLVLRLLPDVNSIVWIPRVEPGRTADVLKALSASGVEPVLITAGRKVIEVPTTEPYYPVLDIEPKTPANVSTYGLVISSLPTPGDALRRAESTRDVAATPPLELVQIPGVPAIVVYVPVFGAAMSHDLLGFVGFSYRLDWLISAAIERSLVAGEMVVVRDVDKRDVELYRFGVPKPDGVAEVTRTIPFAGRSWEFRYAQQRPDFSQTPVWPRFFASGMGLSLILAGAFFSVARSSEKWQREVVAREASDRELVRSEEKMLAILRHAPVAIMIADAPNGRMVYGNRWVETIWRTPFHAAANLEDYRHYRGFHPDDRPYEPEEWPLVRSLHTGEIVTAEEIRIARGDGTFGYISVNSAPIRDETGAIVAGIAAFEDVTAQKQAADQQEVIVRELSHRVKNLLAVIQSMVGQIARRSTSIAQFQEAFAQRIQALSHAHDLLVGRHWESVPLDDLVRSQLGAFSDDAFSRVAMRGPAVSLAPAAAQHLGLAIFELATNAIKYGALSGANGRVEIVWDVLPDGTFRFVWQEVGGPMVFEPPRRGFGSIVLERLSAGLSGATSTLDFRPTGVVWTISVKPRAGEPFIRTIPQGDHVTLAPAP